MGTGRVAAALDLEAGGQMMPWGGSRLATTINTAAHVLWFAFSALLLFHYSIKDWLTSVYRRWKWRNFDCSCPMDPDVSVQFVRDHKPSFSEIKALDKLLATECLEYYNARNPGFEYVLASGNVAQFTATNCTGAWTHGNFVARLRRKGCFSFLYGPPTLFFFELNDSPCNGGIVTCATLDEPVDEANSFMGQLWLATPRNGIYDCVCQACGIRNPSSGKSFSCQHRDVEALCQMCYNHSGVLHPIPGKFQFGHQKDAKFSYLCSCA